MIKAKAWNGKDLKGEWQVTLKIDGVRAFYPFTAEQPQWLSRAGKPLYNMPRPWDLKGFPVPPSGTLDVEVFCGSWNETVERVRASTKARPVKPEELYSLDPLDDRLRGRMLYSGEGNDALVSPDADFLHILLARAVKKGFEGLVLRQGSVWLKVKPIETYDVKVLDAIEGTGKHKGRLGALVTDKGNVGTGFTDDERQNLWHWFITGHSGVSEQPLEGQVVEVQAMGLTPAGKFRHPRFVRLRWDKD